MLSVASNNFAAQRHAMRAALQSHGDCPVPFSHLWQDFKRLHARRPASVSGAAAIPGAEIESDARLMGITHSRDDAEILLTLDALYLASLRAAGQSTAAH